MTLSKTSVNLSLALLVVVITSGLTLKVSGQGKPITTKESVVWEYKLIIPDEKGPDQHEHRRANLESQLNQAGQDGWEAFDTPNLKGIRYQVIIMKRPLVR